MQKITIAAQKLLLSILVISSAFMVQGCDDASGPSGFNLFSASDDVQLGKQLDEEILAAPNEYPMLNNANANAYMQDILDQILASPEIIYKNTFPYQIRIINDNTINAFAAPGGFLYVHKGLIKYLDNEATLAAIIAHEVAHAERRHATKRLTKQYGVSILLSLVLGSNPGVIEEIAANLLTGLSFLKNSRDDEYEADAYSFKYLLSTKWYPGATKLFFEKIGAEQSGGKLTELLSTHPLPEQRIKAMDELIERHNLAPPSEGNLFSEKYLIFKNSLPD